jgi:hypothetical protein
MKPFGKKEISGQISYLFFLHLTFHPWGIA